VKVSKVAKDSMEAVMDLGNAQWNG